MPFGFLNRSAKSGWPRDGSQGEVSLPARNPMDPADRSGEWTSNTGGQSQEGRRRSRLEKSGPAAERGPAAGKRPSDARIELCDTVTQLPSQRSPWRSARGWRPGTASAATGAGDVQRGLEKLVAAPGGPPGAIATIYRGGKLTVLRAGRADVRRRARAAGDGSHADRQRRQGFQRGRRPATSSRTGGSASTTRSPSVCRECRRPGAR